jgi:phosphoglycolate phosphatase-like HAD superfamily hydrolase
MPPHCELDGAAEEAGFSAEVAAANNSKKRGRDASSRGRAVIFDYDQTLTKAQDVLHQGKIVKAEADKVKVFEDMTDEEVVRNFGGEERIGALRTMLRDLFERDVSLIIISAGYRRALLPHLESVGLATPFFEFDHVWGHECERLQRVRFNKSRLITELMQEHGWTYDDVLFVDDSEDHIKKALPVCQTMLVRGNGLSLDEIQAITNRHKVCLKKLTLDIGASTGLAGTPLAGTPRTASVPPGLIDNEGGFTPLSYISPPLGPRSDTCSSVLGNVPAIMKL